MVVLVTVATDQALDRLKVGQVESRSYLAWAVFVDAAPRPSATAHHYEGIMRNRLKIAFVIGALAGPVTAAEKPAAWRELSSAEGLQVAVGGCLVVAQEGENRSLLGALGLSAITKGVNMLGRAVTNAGAAKTWQSTASRNFDADDKSFPECIQVVRGKFTTNPDAANWTLPGWDGASAKLATNGIRLSEAPDFLFEAAFVPSQVNKGFLALRPVQVSFAGPMGTRALRGDKARELAVFASITPPGAKAALATAPGATLTIGRMQPYTYKKFAPPPEGMSSPYESAWFSISKDDLKKPLTINIMVSETQDESAFLTFMGSVIADKPVQDALVKEGSVMFIPEIREQAETDKLAADAKLVTAQALAYADAQGKVAACMVSKNPKADAASAIEALNKYLVADRTAPTSHGRLTVDTVKKIDLNASGDSITASCEAVMKVLAPAST